MADEMIIKYKRKKLRFNLIFGLVWLVFFLWGYLIKDELSWIDYGWLAVSAIYLGLYVYQLKYEYGKIENGRLTVNDVFKKSKEIDLKEVVKAKKFAGDYILETPQIKIKLNTELIDPNSLQQLNRIFESYNINWDN